MLDTHTVETLPGDAHVTSPDGVAAAVSSDALTLDELNRRLGKEFPDVQSAMKALTDTFSYVGKKKEDIAAEVRRELSANIPQTPAPASQDNAKIQSLETRLFYTENPQYKGYEALINSMGGEKNPAEVVNSDVFKDVFSKVKAADASDSRRSVVTSSPHLAQAKSVTDEAVRVANARGSTVDDVALALARGINEEAATV